jgi:hypothetical protein
MKAIRKALRLLFIVLLLIMAGFGIGITGNFLSTNKEGFLDYEIKKEQGTKKKDEDENETIQVKE